MYQRQIAVAGICLSLGLGLPAKTYAQTTPRLLLGTYPYECKNSDPCSTEVSVTASETKSDGSVDPLGCTVSWKFNGYLVKKHTNPKLVWKLVYSGVDTYKFHPNDGVILNTADLNDPSMDLYDQGRDSADGQKFRWRDRNKRKRDKDQGNPAPENRGIRFEFVVLRDRDAYKCAAGDPVVINMGQ